MKNTLITLMVLILAANSGFACEMCKQPVKTNCATTKPVLNKKEQKQAEQILAQLHIETENNIKEGYGPFLAAIYDKNGNLIAKMPNTVVKDQCSLNHAEVNTIKAAQKKLGTYDLAPYDLSIYVNAEPCIMCTGAIIWSGIKKVYYSVSSKDVEEITGFDEGYKPNWVDEFAKRNIQVYGPIQAEQGKQVLKKYMTSGNKIYKPSRT